MGRNENLFTNFNTMQQNFQINLINKYTDIKSCSSMEAFKCIFANSVSLSS